MYLATSEICSKLLIITMISELREKDFLLLFLLFFNGTVKSIILSKWKKKCFMLGLRPEQPRKLNTNIKKVDFADFLFYSM